MTHSVVIPAKRGHEWTRAEPGPRTCAGEAIDIVPAALFRWVQGLALAEARAARDEGWRTSGPGARA